MGPEGGIEPPSGEPQSPMLPLHHSGHWCATLWHFLAQRFWLIRLSLSNCRNNMEMLQLKEKIALKNNRKNEKDGHMVVVGS